MLYDFLMANISRFFWAAATAIIVLCLGGCGEGRGKLQLWLKTPNAENSSLRGFSSCTNTRRVSSLLC